MIINTKYVDRQYEGTMDISELGHTVFVGIVCIEIWQTKDCFVQGVLLRMSIL